MQRITKDIPKFLVSSTADVWYDFQEGVNYYIFDRAKMKLLEVVRIDTEEDAMFIYSEYYDSKEYLVLEEIWRSSGLYEIGEDKATLVQDARRDQLERENKEMVVYTCSECKQDGCGRDLKFSKDDVIPEVCSMECPVCEKQTLVLDREATIRVYSHYIPSDLERKAIALREYTNSVDESEIHFFCNECLEKKGAQIPPTWYYHDTGRCEDCKRVNDVSVPILNKKAFELGLTIDADLEINGDSGRNVLWTDRIYGLKSKLSK